MSTHCTASALSYPAFNAPYDYLEQSILHDLESCQAYGNLGDSVHSTSASLSLTTGASSTRYPPYQRRGERFSSDLPAPVRRMLSSNADTNAESLASSAALPVPTPQPYPLASTVWPAVSKSNLASPYPPPAVSDAGPPLNALGSTFQRQPEPQDKASIAGLDKNNNVDFSTCSASSSAQPNALSVSQFPVKGPQALASSFELPATFATEGFLDDGPKYFQVMLYAHYTQMEELLRSLQRYQTEPMDSNAMSWAVSAKETKASAQNQALVTNRRFHDAPESSLTTATTLDRNKQQNMRKPMGLKIGSAANPPLRSIVAPGKDPSLHAIESARSVENGPPPSSHAGSDHVSFRPDVKGISFRDSTLPPGRSVKCQVAHCHTKPIHKTRHGKDHFHCVSLRPALSPILQSPSSPLSAGPEPRRARSPFTLSSDLAVQVEAGERIDADGGLFLSAVFIPATWAIVINRDHR